MTRVAGANPRIWVDIFLENAGALGDALAEHRRRVEQLEQALSARDAGSLARWIAEASGNRRRMLAEAYPGDPGALQQVIVHVPDRPGVLAGITQALGAERINIEDFELRHFSPERGGTLTILVSGEDEAAPRGVAARGAGLRRLGLAGPRMRIEPAASLQGGLAVPGDKSISHRAVLIGAIADGETVVEGFGRSADTESTIGAARALGAEVGEGGDTVRVTGRRPARPPRAGRRDRLRQRRHAGAPARRDPRRPGGQALSPGRRRVAQHAGR